MCGIIAVIRRKAARSTPAVADVLARIGAIDVASIEAVATASEHDAHVLTTVAEHLDSTNELLSGVPGVTALVRQAGLAASVRADLSPLRDAVAAMEKRLDLASADVVPNEIFNAQLLRVKDALWAVLEDRLRTAEAVSALGGPQASDAALAGFTSVQQALSALDRLEVRGRDSAGLHLFVFGTGLAGDASVLQAVAERSQDGLFRAGSVRATSNGLSFVYKAAAEIGELGDNTAVLRQAISTDDLLHTVLRNFDAQIAVLGHTRWASVGIISEANAHPLNSELESGTKGPYAIGVLNGDVDNHADLCVEAGLCFPAAITTDAKVIPSLLAHNVAQGDSVDEGFRRAVASFEGSVAIGAQSEQSPEDLLLALRGSGQALYVGLAEDAYVVASEPYGLVEMTPIYLRMDGETPANPENPNASRGQIVTLDGSLAGEVAGISRVAYDGTPLPVDMAELVESEITTRDIDRAGYPHFLLKEVTEAPTSFRKTLRGKVHEADGQLHVRLPESTLPADVRAGLRSGDIDEVIAIAQGTAHIAAESFARALQGLILQIPEGEVGHELRVRSLPATELSGFGMDRRFDNVLIVAVSQSGTTTDTNRTVDVVRRKGAKVIAIVNRRGSDLTDKSNGVLYTSDGRDVEMSVASTKAFYSQVAAGFLLATAIAGDVGGDVESTTNQALLRGLLDMPAAMEEVLERRDRIGEIAGRLAPSRRYWAIVGNGPNRVAAEEVRIKLSELCYKSMACDATEDKKHIDLSSEPLILVCAAGLTGSNADDVAKEVAIFRAHKAAPIVITNEGDSRYSNALDVIGVPAVEPALGFILSTMVGHLFGYEAAKAIDALATPLRNIRAAIETTMAESPTIGGATLLENLKDVIDQNSRAYFDSLRQGSLNGHVEASSASRLSILLRYASGVSRLDSFELEFGKKGTPGVVVDELVLALSDVIDELTRPIDAIKHQAKTVTVGISRTDEGLLSVPLVAEVLDAGTARDSLTYENLQTLAALDAAVAEVTGYTRYRIEGVPGTDDARIYVAARGGVGASIKSRVDDDPVLRGTKHRAAIGRRVGVNRGRKDNRTVLLVPETKDSQTIGLTLMHVRFHDTIDPSVARGVLHGYWGRFSALRDAVRETEDTFNEDLLGEIPVIDLLWEPTEILADRWRS